MRSLPFVLYFILANFASLSAQEASTFPWTADLSAGSRAARQGQYSTAIEKFQAALQKAEEANSAQTVVLPILRSLAGAHRMAGEFAKAEELLLRVLGIVGDSSPETSTDAAAVLSELADAQRSQDRRKEATETITKAIQIRSGAGLSEALAKDTVLAGTILQEMGAQEAAKNRFLEALAFWGALPSSGLQILTAIDPLAALYRDTFDYANAEELYVWALHLREAALGPRHAELIATLDSLAYVLSGQKKYEKAEPVYLRLLALWEGSAGREHLMVALTLDKLTEFYAAQKLFDKAEPYAQRSLAMRTKAEIESFHRTGRLLVGQQKFEEALDLYARAVRIGTDAKAPDEAMEGILRSYAMLLKQAGKSEEAAAMDRRVQEVLARKADREGARRPAPEPSSK